MGNVGCSCGEADLGAPGHDPRLDDDGQVYLGLFLDNHAFIWDGKSPAMEVSQGGMGEPVTDTIPMTETNSIAMAVLCMKVAARLYVERDEP